MIDPKTLNPMELPSVSLSNRKLLPAASGIYFAIANGNIQYIGRSTNINHRWANHHRQSDIEPMSEANIAYLLISNSTLLPKVESALIKWFNPPLNGRNALQPTSPEYEKEIRVRLGRVWDEEISNKEVSDATGIPLNTISKYKNGASIGTLNNLWHICQYLSQRLGRKVYLEDVLEMWTVKGVDSPSDSQKDSK